MKVPSRGGILGILFFTVIFFGCSRAGGQVVAAEQTQEEAVPVEIAAAEITLEEIAEAEAAPEEVLAPPRFTLNAESARPGDPVTVGHIYDSGESRPGSLQAVLLSGQGRRLAKSAFFSLGAEEGGREIMAAILAVPYGAAAGNATIRVEAGDDVIRDLPFRIESRQFVSETIDLDQSNTEIRTTTDPRRAEESQQLWAILTRTGSALYTDGVFTPPVTSTRRTSQYGHRRVYRYVDGNTDTSVHAGLDYGVPTGTPVMAVTRGRVVLAKSRIVTGNTVVLEHMPGVYSLYYHMDKIAVEEGEIVEAGRVLGESGSTGLSTGPHLHWEMRVSSEYIDPDAFLVRNVLDKDDIINKMMEQ